MARKSSTPPGVKKIPAKDWDFPPDIFWITPDGGVVEVIGHLTAVQQSPETFGLPGAPGTREEISRVWDDLFFAGWTRGRFSLVDGLFYFEMDRPRGIPMGNAYDLLVRFQGFAREVQVDFYDPSHGKFSKRFTAPDFLAQRFPVAWRLNPGRKRRTP